MTQEFQRAAEYHDPKGWPEAECYQAGKIIFIRRRKTGFALLWAKITRREQTIVETWVAK